MSDTTSFIIFVGIFAIIVISSIYFDTKQHEINPCTSDQQVQILVHPDGTKEITCKTE